MVSLWFWFVLPLMICALQLGLPLLTRKVLKRRRLIYPIMVSFHCFLSNLLFEIGFGYAFKYIDHIDVSVTVAGVLLPILQLIWIVMLFVATSQSKSIASEIEKANAQSHTLESVE